MGTPLRQIHKMICFLRRKHRYGKTVIINDNLTRKNCKCGDYPEIDWRSVGGYKRVMDIVADRERRIRWNES